MDSKLKTAFLNLYQSFREQDNSKTDRLDKWRNIEPESAAFISFLGQTKRATNVLEINTSNGFSTLWLAEATLDTNGSVTSMDSDQLQSKETQHHLQHFQLDQHVIVHTCDAVLFLQKATADYAFILLDAERHYYTSYWANLHRLLQHPNPDLVVDTVLSHAQHVVSFITGIKENEFQKRLMEYPMLKQMLKASEEYISSPRNDIEYYRTLYQKHSDMHGKPMNSIKERNFIEAKKNLGYKNL